MFFNYGYEVSKILKNAENERYNLAHPYVGSEHLLLSILSNDETCIKIFSSYNVTYDSFNKALLKSVSKASKKQKINLYTPLLKRIIAEATNNALEEKREVTCSDFIIALLEEAEGIAFRLLLSMDVDIEKLYKDFKQLNKKDNKLITVDIGTNLNEYVDPNEKIVGRDKELNEIIEIILRKKKNNPVLIGKAGVGKTAIVEELARRINKGQIPLSLKDKQIISIELGELVAGTKYRGEFEERLTKIINEVLNNKNIILFIDEIHSIVNAGGSEGAINAADILKPYMARGDIKIIGATTEEEYEKYITNDKALDRRLEKVYIEEPSLDETISLMLQIKNEYEEYHHIKISDDVIKYLVTMADKLIINKNNPDKSIELLDTVCSHVKLSNTKISSNNEEELNKLKNKYLKKHNYEKASYYYQEKLKLEDNRIDKELKITKKDILNTISYRVKIPSLNNLKILKKELNNINIDKDNKRKILDIIKDKINSIDILKTVLLVGEDELLKVLVKYYNLLSKPIIIDLKEYDNINKLLGVSAGYVGYNDDYALKKIKNSPYSLVVFKNVDKASKDVKMAINKIIKEGIITSGKGDRLDFTKSLIIGTRLLEKNTSVGFDNRKKIYDKLDFDEILIDNKVEA